MAQLVDFLTWNRGVTGSSLVALSKTVHPMHSNDLTQETSQRDCKTMTVTHSMNTKHILMLKRTCVSLLWKL